MSRNLARVDNDPATTKAAKNSTGSELVEAGPNKRFFVEMLTRDIDLIDAVLDLLDNCVDGIIRSPKKGQSPTLPYRGFWAKIDFDEKSFKIEDNCGGIPLDIARKYAFMLGRPRDAGDADKPTVGMYGIGMKRAMFKIGMRSRVISHTTEHSFEVDIKHSWLTDDDDWKLPLEFISPITGTDGKPHVGTTIEIEMLNKPIKKAFAPTGSTFGQDFETAVAQHYSFIIKKGFRVEVNGTEIKPVPLVIMSSDLVAESKKKEITPYIYKGNIDGVVVTLVCGFNKPMPSPDEIDNEQEARRSRENAGWTVICNDRVIVYNDRSRLTGWGEADVPSYHTQFIAISGVVFFQSNDAWKLPVTTTKRNLDSSSDLYLYVKDFMREALKKFTSYTNKWKSYADDERAVSSRARPVAIEALAKVEPDDEWTKVRNSNNERRFNIDLPEPPRANLNTTIRFVKPTSQVREVSTFLFGEPDATAKEVGEGCFEQILEQAKQ